MAISNGAFHYLLSCDLDVPLRVCIGSLEGAIPKFPPILPTSTMIVTVTVRCNGREIGCPVSTEFCRDFSGDGDSNGTEPENESGNRRGSRTSSMTTRTTVKWNEWLTLPVMYSELSRDANLLFQLWDVDITVEPKFVAHAVIPLYSKWAVLRSGMIDLKMDSTRPPKEPTVVEKAFSFDDWPMVPSSTTSSSKSRPSRFSKQTPDIGHLMKLTKDYENGLIPAIDWLDRVTLPAIEKLKSQKKKDQRSLFLMIKMARVHFDGEEYAVVYYEREEQSAITNSGPDPEMGLENLVELKHQMMTRNVRSDVVDRALKPDSKARDALELAIQVVEKSLEIVTAGFRGGGNSVKCNF